MKYPNERPSIGERIRIALLAAVGVILLSVAAGCAGARQAEPAGDAGETPSAEHPQDADDVQRDVSGHVPADAEFTRDMIVHHAQALEMTALAPDNAGSEDIQLLARRIEQTQEYEIDLMRRWLEERGEPLPEVDLGPHGGHEAGAGGGHDATAAADDHAGGHAGMAGMATPEQMAALAEAEGAAFDRMFLELMIRHHEGALVMLDELDEHEGAGNEPELFLLLSHIDADQRAEIARMQRMLDALD